MDDRPRLLDVVAMLDDLREPTLSRGQVGTVVELLDEAAALVEFSDDDGRPYALIPVALSTLLPLHYEPVTG
jgi:Domain of unknown function (DUF4926)